MLFLMLSLMLIFFSTFMELPFLYCCRLSIADFPRIVAFAANLSSDVYFSLSPPPSSSSYVSFSHLCKSLSCFFLSHRVVKCQLCNFGFSQARAPFSSGIFLPPSLAQVHYGALCSSSVSYYSSRCYPTDEVGHFNFITPIHTFHF